MSVIFPLPADLPSDFVNTSAVTATGTPDSKHGYQYLNDQVNAAQTGANQLNTTLEDHIGAGGSAVHAEVTYSTDGFMKASDKLALDEHIGYGGSQHPAATEGIAGFMSAEDKTNLDSLSAGLQSLFTNGYQYLPKGSAKYQLILQWGTVTMPSPANKYTTYTFNSANGGFPISFPTACFNVTATALYTSTSGGAEWVPIIQSFNRSSFNMAWQAYDSGSRAPNGTYWFAIGY